jgi:RHS repeat-associated protein
MTQFTFTDDYDEFGQPRRRTQIACPRGWRALTDRPDSPYLATRTRTVFAVPGAPGPYICDRVARATSYEIVDQGQQGLLDLRDLPDDSPFLQVIGQTLNFYDRDVSQPENGAFLGLPCGQLGDYGALVRSESLVLTEEILHEAYRSGSAVLTPPEKPPYLIPGASPAWTAEYALEFRDLVPPLAGYHFRSGPEALDGIRGYFAFSERRRYDFHEDHLGHGQGLVNVLRDPLGHDTSITYDVFRILPTEVTDQVGLIRAAAYDYRLLQPRELTDPNGNRTAFVFTPLGLLQSTVAMGKVGEQVGDTPEVPGLRMIYDLQAFRDRGQPISVRTIRRVYHVQDTEVALPEKDDTLEAVEYSDGFGRLLQTRGQVEDVTFGEQVFGGQTLPANQAAGEGGDVVGRSNTDRANPNVLVSGWQVYDNKGRVVDKYEPFFTKGWEYAVPTDAQLGQKVTMYYDPRGRVVRKVNPDAAEQRVIYGVPGTIAAPDVSNPDKFEATPWEVYTYDANDNAGRTHPTLSTSYQGHWNTPSSIVLDSLGRTILVVERNGQDRVKDWFTVQMTYDIQGNPLTVIDSLNRLAFQHVYDLAQHPLRIDNIDSGLRRIVLNAQGGEIERRDSEGALILHAYDPLSRPLRLWARDDARSPTTLREHLTYGDESDSSQSSAQRSDSRGANRLGRLWRHYDEAGLQVFDTYDFKGNVLEKHRQVIADAAILAVFTPPPPDWGVQAFRVNWQPPAGTTLDDLGARLLDSTSYQTSLSYDALNRLQMMLYPQDVEGARKALRPRYNRASVLEHLELDGTVYVEHIAYNAKKQRTFTAHGNGLMIRYAYHERTFRLARMRTERYAQLDLLTYRVDRTKPPEDRLLQDFAYEYDLAGNVVLITDRTPGSGIPNTTPGPDALDRTFTYDPLYRLTTATGRECAIPPPLPAPYAWDDQMRCTDVTRTSSYIQSYQYDPAGNVTELRHQGSGSFTRIFELVPNTNRLARMTSGATSFSYIYELNGNLTQENTERHCEWDHGHHMRVFRNQVGSAEPSKYVHYLYDTRGQRVMKVVRKQGGAYEVTVYIEGTFEHHRAVSSGSVKQNNRLHIMDDQSRIAILRIGDKDPDDAGPDVQYHLKDHVGSSNVVADETGALINREEYFPYGETSFGSFARKRYRFTSKERDDESGLYYHGARYYAPWLLRWASCDPLGLAAGVNLYAAFADNPINRHDPTGAQAEITPDMVFKDKEPRAPATRPEGWDRLPEERERKKELDEPAEAAVRGYSSKGRTIFEPNLLLLPGHGSGTPGFVVLGALPDPLQQALSNLRPPTLERPAGTRGPEPGSEGTVDIDPLTVPHLKEHDDDSGKGKGKGNGKKDPPPPPPSGGTPAAPPKERVLFQEFVRIVTWKQKEERAARGQAPASGGGWTLVRTVTAMVKADVGTSTWEAFIGEKERPHWWTRESSETVELRQIVTPYDRDPLNPLFLGMALPGIEEARRLMSHPQVIRLP